MDAFAVKASTCDLAALGERMKAAREALGLTQATFHEQFGYGSVRTYQKNEAGTNEAGICLVGAFVRAGINANWLLSGDGPMLLSELSTMAGVDTLVAQRDELADSLQKALEKAWEAPPTPQAQRINVDALEAIIEGLLRSAPKAPAAKLANVAANLYQNLIDKEMITPDGVGDGDLDDAL